MATDTVPAAVPGPNDSHGNTADPATTPQQPGWLTSLLAPVQPARSAAFSLDPALDAQSGEWASQGASSAAYASLDAGQNPGHNTSGNSTSSRQQTGVIRAWLLAGAERWKQGGVARNKRFDYLKAKAAASQTKTTRTESINNAGGFLGNTRSNSGGNNAGKTPSGNQGRGSGGGLKADKKPQQAPNRAKNNGKGSPGPSGAGGGSGTGGAGNRSRHGGDTRTPRKTPTPQDVNKPAKDSVKNDRNNPAGQGNAGGSKTTGGRGPAGKDAPRNNKGPSPADTRGKNHDRAPKTPKPNADPAPKAKPDTKTPKPDHSLTKDPTKPANPPKTTPAPDTTGARKSTPETPKPGQQDPKNTPHSLKKTPANSPAGTQDAAKNKSGQGNGSGLNLQDSRETGYRDGTRAKKVTAHLEAWRDGARDGWNDTQKAVDREKTRLDTAHADRMKNTIPVQEPKDTPVPKTAAYQPHIPPRPTTRPTPAPTPAPTPSHTQTRTPTDTKAPLDVHSIVGNTITLSGNTARPTISRGEVRTLRRFQQRLEHKADTLTRMAEVTRALEEHAQQQAHRVIQLLEQAKAVKGGDRLIGKLSKLADDATTQACEAAEIHKRALRAADRCRAVHANAEARYGPIYKAIVNACEPESAELAYYRGMGNA